MILNNNKKLQMKNKLLIFSAILAVSFSSCTGDFNDINNNDANATSNLLAQDYNNIKGPIQAMQRSMYTLVADNWIGDIQFNLNADQFSGYMQTPHNFGGNSSNHTYDLNDGWNYAQWEIGYQKEMINAYNVEQVAKTKYPQYYAWSLILKVYAMHKVADYYGPIVYSGFGTQSSTIPYDSQEEAYNHFFEDLTTAVGILKSREVADKPFDYFVSSDGTTAGGDYAKWIKFANSLRLRLALRISNVNPAKAKIEGEAAIASGVIESNADNIFYKADHPVKTYTGPWFDIKAGASLVSIMNGYNDPRRAQYLHTTKTGTYQGIRLGTLVNDDYRFVKEDEFSKIGAVVENGQIPWFVASESHFLKAEAALKGWNVGGTADQFYKSGIATSFAQHGAGDPTTYTNENTLKAEDFVDPILSENNIVGVNNVTVAWDATASNEVKLQKIMTQKWIAIFPDGQEAWAEVRRTGYPKTFLPTHNYSGGKIPVGTFVKRINFPVSEKTTNPNGYAQGVQKLGGVDTGGTALWWDTGVNKF
jgi:hypothetical protein